MYAAIMISSVQVSFLSTRVLYCIAVYNSNGLHRNPFFFTDRILYINSLPF